MSNSSTEIYKKSFDSSSVENTNRSKSTNNNQKLMMKTPTPMKRKNKSKEELSTIHVQQQTEIKQSPKQLTKIRTETTAKRQKIEHNSNNINKNLVGSQTEMHKQQTIEDGSSEIVVAGKPPLPPKPDKSVISQIMKVKATPKMKRKLEETNAILVQKLNALADKLRLENADLMKALASEKCAVRTLRAQTEADTRRAKIESKKLQDAILAKSKLSSQKTKDSTVTNNNGHDNMPDISKLNHEIQTLKDANKVLEEKLQISSEAERKKSSDILEMKDIHEIRLTQANKSAKSETQRLLEEIKTKERTINLLRKENESLAKKTNQNINTSSKMRKLKDAERSSNSNASNNMTSCSSNKTNINNKIIISTTCGDSEFVTMPPHDDDDEAANVNVVATATETTAAPSDFSTERILEAQNELNDLYDRTNNNNNNNSNKRNSHEIISHRLDENHLHNNKVSDLENDHIDNHHHHHHNDNITTALSPTCTTDTDSALSSAPSSLSPQPASCPNSPDLWNMRPSTKDDQNLMKIDNLQKELDTVRDENDFLKCELMSAQQQITELEKHLFEIREGSVEQIEKLNEKLKYLREREDQKQQENHELREQNELLEFRIIELEESHDKWSLRSNSTPDTRDVWTDTEKENEDLVLMSELSDSGITSPNNSHHMDVTESPSDDMSIDQIHHDDVRKRLMIMAKRMCYDEEDRMCLLQVLSLLNNLEALSQDHEISATEILNSELPKISEPTYRPALPSNNQRNQRIVATVFPYNSCDNSPSSPSRTRSLSTSSLNTTVEQSPKKAKFCSTTSLQESGVFEGELYEFISESTQTEPEDFPCLEKSNAELCAEIQKLNKFRERIEECVTKTTSTTTKSQVANILTETPEQRRLQYYRDRLDLLENKIRVYESSGDLQVRRLAERLQREIQLESIVKQLTEKLDKLSRENQLLEEEKCEFEEAENDTRLRLQRLEFDLEIISQRNIELEMSRNSMKAKAQDYQQHCIGLEDTIQKYQDKIFQLEERETELTHQLDLITKIMPVLFMFRSWLNGELTRENYAQQLALPQPKIIEVAAVRLDSDNTSVVSTKNPLEDRLNELMEREKELTKNIAELNKAYNETLENADNLWAQMEREYKDKIVKSEEMENVLRAKLMQLEERLKSDAQFAQERIAQLEEIETTYKQRITRIHKENRELIEKYEQVQDELLVVREETNKLRSYLKGPAHEQLEKERRKVRDLEDELQCAQAALKDTKDKHKTDMASIKNQLTKNKKELINIEVTNGELKEEIFTLENTIRELKKVRLEQEDQIKGLTMELKNSETQYMRGAPDGQIKTLAQEMGPPSPLRRREVKGMRDLSSAAQRLTEAIERMEECKRCMSTNVTITELAKDVKDLTESVLHKNQRQIRNSRRSTTTNLEEQYVILKKKNNLISVLGFTFLVRSAVVRSSSTQAANEIIDDVESPVNEFDEATLAIRSNSRGNVEDVWQRPKRRPLPDDSNIILRFEIPYARVLPVSTEKSVKKYVVYDVSVQQDSSTSDPNPATIERRYTDFLNLYDNLRRNYPNMTQNVVFPKKVLVGNFSTDLIAERSAAFETFLDYIVTVAQLRDSPYFLEFLQGDELKRSCQLLDERRNELAVPILENCFRLLNKIYLDRSKCVLLLLCRLVAACTTSPVAHPMAEKYAELALRRYESVCDTELLVLYVPLLQTCSHLWWQLGRDNKLIEERLENMTVRGMKVKDGPTLTQAIHQLEPRAETT